MKGDGWIARQVGSQFGDGALPGFVTYGLGVLFLLCASAFTLRYVTGQILVARARWLARERYDPPMPSQRDTSDP